MHPHLSFQLPRPPIPKPDLHFLVIFVLGRDAHLADLDALRSEFAQNALGVVVVDFGGGGAVTVSREVLTGFWLGERVLVVLALDVGGGGGGGFLVAGGTVVGFVVPVAVVDDGSVDEGTDEGESVCVWLLY